MTNFLQPVHVEEPSVDETVGFLRGLAPRLQSHHGVRFTEGALRAAAACAKRHFTERRLPDSAIDLLDETAAAAALRRHVAGSSSGAAGVAHPARAAAPDTGDTTSPPEEQPYHETPTPPAAAPASEDDAMDMQTWHGWVEGQGWRGPPELRRQRLLEWFGATPAQPLPGPQGHRQVRA